MASKLTIILLALAALAAAGAVAWHARREQRRIAERFVWLLWATWPAYARGHADGLSDGFERGRREARGELERARMFGYSEALADFSEMAEAGIERAVAA